MAEHQPGKKPGSGPRRAGRSGGQSNHHRSKNRNQSGGDRRRGPASKAPGSQSRGGQNDRPQRSGQRPAVIEQPERLNKILAKAGLGSRRAVEELILQGRVAIDGQTVRDLATKANPERAKITVDGERVRSQRTVYLAVNKPKGYLTTNHDPSGRPRVVDLVPDLPQRVYPIGRLDEESTGLILLTNDGDLANRLAHPKFGVEKIYQVLVAGQPGPEILDRLIQGVWLAEGKARARTARFIGGKNRHQGNATMIEMTLAEGKNREIRRMLAKLGHKVMSLNRVAVGPVTPRGLAIGKWRHLEPAEVALLRRAAGGESISAFAANRPERSNQGGRHAGDPRARSRSNQRGASSIGPRTGMGHLVGGTRRGNGSGSNQTSSGPARGKQTTNRQLSKESTKPPRRGSNERFTPPPRESRPPVSRPAASEHEEVLVPPMFNAGPLPPPSIIGETPTASTNRPSNKRPRPPKTRLRDTRPPTGGSRPNRPGLGSKRRPKPLGISRTTQQLQDSE